MTAKRTFDLVASLLGGLMLLPVGAFIALLIRLDDRGPVFFVQERVGRGGRPFGLYKFRTMRVAGAAGEAGPQLTVGRDPRITRAGSVLRRYKLDELPQLLNVIRGEMSLVGPRPEVPRYVAMYTPEQRAVLSVRPGITDLASIKYRHENALLAESSDPESTYVSVVMPDKLRLNLDYLRHGSLVSDVSIILKTLLHILR